MHIVKKGDVLYKIDDLVIKRFFTGEYFEEIPILTDHSNFEGIYAGNEGVVLYSLSKSGLIKIFGDDYKNDLLYSIFLHTLKSSILFKETDNSLFAEIFSFFSLKLYNSGDVIYNYNNYKKLVIVLDGNFVYDVSLYKYFIIIPSSFYYYFIRKIEQLP